jgi:hypothetical protein
MLKNSAELPLCTVPDWTVHTSPESVHPVSPVSNPPFDTRSPLPPALLVLSSVKTTLSGAVPEVGDAENPAVGKATVAIAGTAIIVMHSSAAIQ